MFKIARTIHLMIFLGTTCLLHAAQNPNNSQEHFGQQNPMRDMRSPHSPIVNPFPYGTPPSTQTNLPNTQQ